MVTTDPAYSEFVLSRQARLRRVAVLLCGDPDQGEDLLQEAFVALAEKWEKVEHPDAFVRTVLARQRVSWWRRRRHEVISETVPDRGLDLCHQAVGGCARSWRLARPSARTRRDGDARP
ncbi:hypothetical protein MWU75_18525 [Ornithinimicrobium sp. F0845]|uniref:sigma factor n=1 Tax=Ornithinimicrobium sp. F0845 TaxID=2926412 RepID=UPI001FF19652|nr:hypothetical protein [Ornithinimicrobium sp. F0845]